MRKHVSLFLIVVVASAMLTSVDYDCLWGPDEPREAEIARETLVEGHWVTPHLCGLPFLEKPPLYYDVVALAYMLTGRITPAVARSISVLFATIMLISTFVFGYRWRGTRAAWLMVMVLLTMPRFWKYGHWILLDIAVGAFCACALTCFAGSVLWATSDKSRGRLLSLFALFSAAAFLTKGFAAIFNIALIVAAFCFLERSWSTLKRIFSPLPLLIFFIPVAVWVLLYYREGGMGYLHEIFINNVIGRVVQVRSALPATRFYDADFGPQHPWYYYLQVLPEIIGIWVVILPFAIWRSIGEIRASYEKQGRAFLYFVLIWTFLPAIVLSFSPTKERTYILPSYAGMAILVGYWLDLKLFRREKEVWRGIGWFWIVLPFVLFSFLFAHLEPVKFIIIAVGIISPAVAFLIYLFVKRRLTEGTYLVISIILCVLIVISSPNVLNLRYSRRCYIPFAHEAWSRVGANPLYLYQPRDTLRGTIPFTAKRAVYELDRPVDLKEVLMGPTEIYVVMRERVFKKLSSDPTFDAPLFLAPPGRFETDPDYVLVSNRRD